MYPIAVNGRDLRSRWITCPVRMYIVKPGNTKFKLTNIPTPTVPTTVSASAEDNSTQPIVVSADTNENSIHHEPTVITEPAITVSQPQTKSSELMKDFLNSSILKILR